MPTITDYVDGQWLGRPVGPTDDPWYRFGRVISLVETIRPVTADQRWLDLGCNQGQLLTVLNAKFGLRGKGVDDWPGQSEGRRFDYQQGDLATEFEIAGEYDVVSALEVLEHMIDTDAFLQRCQALLSKNGLLVISTPNINSLRNRVMVPFGAYPAGLEYRNQIHHVRLYNRATLISHLAEHGLRTLATIGVNALPQRLLANAAVERLSRGLANAMPQLCGNIIVVCTKA